MIPNYYLWGIEVNNYNQYINFRYSEKAYLCEMSLNLFIIGFLNYQINSKKNQYTLKDF